MQLHADPELRWFVGGPQEPEVVRESLSFDVDQWGRFIVADAQDRAIGTLSFDRKRGPWELSFQLRQEFWGQGLMTEAATLALDWFFTSQGDRRCIAVTQVGNARTRALLERLGAKVTDMFEYNGSEQVEYEFESGGPR